MYSPLFTRLGHDYLLELERDAERKAARQGFNPAETVDGDPGERMRKLVEAAEEMFAIRLENSDGCQLCMEGGD